MRWRKIEACALICLGLWTSSCQRTPFNSATKFDPVSNVAATTDEIVNQPPFATKEPEKYSAKIVFAFRYDEAASNFIEQNYFVARDGANRRLDFESADREISYLQTADGKQTILLPKQKVYAELTAPEEKAEATTFTNQPNDFSLGNLLYAKPINASFVRVGNEEVAGRQTTKYQLDFGTVKESETVRTQTFVWADENLGLPIKTEVIALENDQPTGAKNIIELREIKTEVDPQLFEVPLGSRKITFQEIRQILRQQ